MLLRMSVEGLPVNLVYCVYCQYMYKKRECVTMGQRGRRTHCKGREGVVRNSKKLEVLRGTMGDAHRGCWLQVSAGVEVLSVISATKGSS